MGWGRFEPLFRYQQFDRDDSNRARQRGDRERYEVNLNYIFDGHNARVSLVFANKDPGPENEDINIFKIGVQIQL